jgi:hypothetical protein
MDPEPRSTPGLAFYQQMMETDRDQRVRNKERVWELANNPRAGVRVFCSHDPIELEALSRLSTGMRPRGTARPRNHAARATA